MKLDGERVERLASAWPAETAPCFDLEPGPVIDALDMALVERHELVFDELQGPARMGA